MKGYFVCTPDASQDLHTFSQSSRNSSRTRLDLKFILNLWHFQLGTPAKRLTSGRILVKPMQLPSTLCVRADSRNKLKTIIMLTLTAFASSDCQLQKQTGDGEKSRQPTKAKAMAIQIEIRGRSSGRYLQILEDRLTITRPRPRPGPTCSVSQVFCPWSGQTIEIPNRHCQCRMSGADKSPGKGDLWIGRVPKKPRKQDEVLDPDRFIIGQNMSIWARTSSYEIVQKLSSSSCDFVSFINCSTNLSKSPKVD